MDMIYDTLNEDIKKRIEEEQDHITTNIPSDIVAKFYLGAVFNVGMEWMKNHSKYTKQEIIEYLGILLPTSI